jgi:hypothetical protein
MGTTRGRARDESTCDSTKGKKKERERKEKMEKDPQRGGI